MRDRARTHRRLLLGLLSAASVVGVAAACAAPVGRTSGGSSAASVGIMPTASPAAFAEAASGAPPAASMVGVPGVVTSVVDGDTIHVRVGTADVRVRLVQIDAPETHVATECYGPDATRHLAALIAPGTAVSLYRDPALDDTDRYGRLLRYVYRGSLNVNLRMVSDGAAAPYFFGGDLGRYSTDLQAAAGDAIAAHRGLWQACPHARLDPYRALDSGPAP